MARVNSFVYLLINFVYLFAKMYFPDISRQDVLGRSEATYACVSLLGACPSAPLGVIRHAALQLFLR